MTRDKERSVRMQKGETGYSWLFFYARRSWVYSLVMTLIVIGVSGTFYWWYSHYGNDPTPNGNVGLSYGLAGLTFLVLAATSYSVRRRFQNNALGRLHSALNWHVFFAFIGLALLLMHSFGNFNPDSGTYALASMVALTVSGVLGRALDRFLSWRIAIEVQKVLTVEGEDRIEAISDALAHHLPVAPDAQQQIARLKEIERAMRSEQRYRYVIYYWRKLHIALAMLTLGLTIWHLLYGIPFLLHSLFSSS